MIWQYLSDFGDAAFAGPLAAGIAVYLAVSGREALAMRWILVFGTAVGLVLASKVAFMGFGLGIQRLDFTGISGHSMQAASTLPVAAAVILAERGRAARRLGILVALFVALAVGYSRWPLHAHSPAEIVAGLALGLVVAALMLPWIVPAESASPRHAGWGYAAVLALLFVGTHDHPAPAQEVVEKVALKLSGRTEPYTRALWHTTWVDRSPSQAPPKTLA